VIVWSVFLCPRYNVSRWCASVCPAFRDCLSTMANFTSRPALFYSKVWFEIRKKCLKRESNPRSLVCRACTLTNRPWMLGWVGLMWACGAVATCVWLACGLRPSHFNCLRPEGSQLTHMNGARDSVLAFLSRGRKFDSHYQVTVSPPNCNSKPPWSIVTGW